MKITNRLPSVANLPSIYTEINATAATYSKYLQSPVPTETVLQLLYFQLVNAITGHLPIFPRRNEAADLFLLWYHWAMKI